MQQGKRYNHSSQANRLGACCADREALMNVNIAEAVQIVLENLGEEERRRVWAWIDHLRRWEYDPYVRQHSKKLELGENVYMLLTSTEIRIFFELHKDSITVLDVAKKATIIRSGGIDLAG